MTNRIDERSGAPGLFALISAVAVCTACGADAPSHASVTVRDSAGVRIVESREAEGDADTVWTLSRAPAVQIGTVEGAPEYELFRITDALRLADGRIMVASAGTHDLRVYSPGGEHLQTVGREGSGPGEFRSPHRLFRLPGDSIAVLDLHRISVLAPALTFVRSVRYALPAPVARLADGRWLRVASVNATGELGLVRNSVVLLASLPNGGRADTTAHLAGSERYRVETGRYIAQYRAPFGRERAVTIDNNRVFTGDGSSFEIRVFTARRGLTAVIRRPDPALEIGPEEIANFERDLLASARSEEQRRTLSRLTREWSYPNRRPAYDRLIVDRAGSLWVRHYHLGEGPRRWSVFGRDHAWLCDVTTPSDLEVYEIGEDYVLGKAVDELGVEYMRAYALVKLEPNTSADSRRNSG